MAGYRVVQLHPAVRPQLARLGPSLFDIAWAALLLLHHKPAAQAWCFSRAIAMSTL